MDSKRVERVYSFYSGFYDLLFGKIFHKSRAKAIDLLEITPGEQILEVGVGTGLSLPLYPTHCKITGIDLSRSMLDKSWRRVQKQNLSHVTLQKMDATRMDFPDNAFDSILAAYVISTVPDPKIVVEEMARVCKDGGKIVFLNHFKNGKKWISVFEKTVSPLCKRIGFRTDLDLGTILKNTPLVVNRKNKIHRFHIWKAVQCLNQKENGAHLATIESSSQKTRTTTQPFPGSETPDISQKYSPDPICPN